MTAVPDTVMDRMIEDLLARLPWADRAIVLSADGLLIGRSASLHRDDAEHLSAVASAVQSLARGAGRHFDGGPVRQTIIEMERSFLIVTSAGAGACLAVLADAEADLGLLAYEMNLMVRRVGTHLDPRPRNPYAANGNEPGASRIG